VGGAESGHKIGHFQNAIFHGLIGGALAQGFKSRIHFALSYPMLLQLAQASHDFFQRFIRPDYRFEFVLQISNHGNLVQKGSVSAKAFWKSSNVMTRAGSITPW
jgi:hypothetical protein